MIVISDKIDGNGHSIDETDYNNNVNNMHDNNARIMMITVIVMMNDKDTIYFVENNPVKRISYD